MIGNPPYVAAPAQIANPILAGQRKRLLKSGLYETLYQKWDLYVPFMEKGLKMLCKDGSFAMIVPFPLSNQVYGRNFRKWVTANYNVWEITDLNGTKIFENATVSNLIMFAKNDGVTDKTTISHIVPPMSILPDFTQSISNLVQGNDTAVWNFTRQKRVPKSHSAMKTLGDFCYISVGMVLNADETKAKGDLP